MKRFWNVKLYIRYVFVDYLQWDLIIWLLILNNKHYQHVHMYIISLDIDNSFMRQLALVL